jgi:histidine triad (HIT) family protein
VKMDCIFCKIIAGQIPTEILYQDEEIIAFRDIKPLAPVHLLIVPRKHVPSLNDMKEGDAALVGRMVSVASRLAVEQGIADRGYRLVINCGKEGGQLVPHVHMHLLGGRQLNDKLS